MNHHYKDIRDRIHEPPKWFDENAVPRYCDFSPEETADIYAIEAVLFEIACQRCGTRFKVCLSQSRSSRILLKHTPLCELIQNRALDYGDPPNMDCCPAGSTMTSDPIRVLEYWSRDSFDWVRHPEYEHEIGS